MNDKILELFINENEAWDYMIKRESKEIPDLEKRFWALLIKKRVGVLNSILPWIPSRKEFRSKDFR
jgi:hypothetical protein